MLQTLAGTNAPDKELSQAVHGRMRNEYKPHDTEKTHTGHGIRDEDHDQGESRKLDDCT